MKVLETSLDRTKMIKSTVANHMGFIRMIILDACRPLDVMTLFVVLHLSMIWSCTLNISIYLNISNPAL